MFKSVGHIICVMLLLCGRVSAQQLHFRKLGSDEGLTVNTINKIIQDKQGFVWIATMDGLNRYDGYDVKQFYSGDSTQSFLPHNDILNLFCDDEGFIWISTTDVGLTRYCPHTQSKQLFTKDSTRVGMINFWVTDFAQTSNEGVWIATRKGLCYFEKKSGRISRVDTTELDPVGIVDVLPVDAQTLWLSNRKGLLIYNIPQGRVTQRLFSNQSVLKAEYWQDGKFLVMLQNQRLVLLTKTGQELALINPLMHQPLITMLVDKRKQVWITSQNGLYAYNPTTGSTKMFLHNAYDPHSVSTNTLSSLFEDRTGTIWAGSINAGVNYFDPKGVGFNVLQSPVQLQTFSNIVLGICEDLDGSVWLANSGGLTNWNRITNRIQNILHDSTRKDALPAYTTTRSVYVSDDGSLWVATGGKGVLRRKKGTSNFVSFTHDTSFPKQSLSNNFVYSIQQLRNGEIWASTSRGVSRFNKYKNQFESFDGDTLLKDVARTSVWKVSDDSKGNIWFATAGNGAYYWNRKANTLQHFTVNKDEPGKGIVFNHVWCVTEDKAGNYWLGTTNGLSRIDAKLQHIINYTRQNGLPNHSIYGILCDARGDLWMSSNLGIIKYDITRKEFKNYQIHDGVQSNEFNQEAFYQSTRTGEFFFGGVKGINYFNPLSITEIKSAPSVFIGDVSIFEGQSVKQITLAEAQILQFSYLQDFISVEYAADDYYHNTQTRYRYKMLGVDANWVEGGNNHMATYSNLIPGDYRFEVIASNNGVDWSETPAFVSIHIDPPFWKTWWFRLLLAIVIPACIGLFIRRRFEAVRNKTKLAEELVELKMQALRAQMNPHFIFNALNSIQHLIVKGDGELAFSYLSKFSRLLRMILDVSDHTFIPMDKEIDMLRLYLDLEALRFDHHMQYSIEVDEDDITGLSIPTLLLQPYVENAIWHGLVPKDGERKLHIGIMVAEHHMIIRVEDNGIGRKKAAEMKSMQPIRYESKGMNINNDRLRILKSKESGTIVIEDLMHSNGDAAGTRVIITLPLAALTDVTI